MARIPKTQGVDWLGHSLVSFNGSGYADRSSSEAYINSYIAYKTMKKKTEPIKLVRENWYLALSIAQTLIETSTGPSRFPSDKRLEKFKEYYTFL